MREQSLRTAIQNLEAAGQLVRVKPPVDWRFEASAILWELGKGPAVLMEQIVDNLALPSSEI